MVDQYLQSQRRAIPFKKGGKNKENKKRKVQPSREPIDQLAIDTAKLALDNRKQIRKQDAGLTHTGLGDVSAQDTLNPAIETTEQFRGGDQVEGAARS